MKAIVEPIAQESELLPTITISFDERMYVVKNSNFLKMYQNKIKSFFRKPLNKCLIQDIESSITTLLHLFRSEGQLFLEDDLIIQMINPKNIQKTYHILYKSGEPNTIRSVPGPPKYKIDEEVIIRDDLAEIDIKCTVKKITETTTFKEEHLYHLKELTDVRFESEIRRCDEKDDRSNS